LGLPPTTTLCPYTTLFRSLKGKVDMKHFTPNYEPWDQRLCVVPDGDLFKILREGHASVETDHIEKLTETGILLKSGKHLEADIIVSATGLNIQILGGIQIGRASCRERV